MQSAGIKQIAIEQVCRFEKKLFQAMEAKAKYVDNKKAYNKMINYYGSAHFASRPQKWKLMIIEANILYYTECLKLLYQLIK